jgi:hypothetical protein
LGLCSTSSGSSSDQRLLQLSTGQLSSEAPYRMSELACWASEGKIAAVLNQRGEILLFHRQSLRFARRGGSWHHYVHGRTSHECRRPPRSLLEGRSMRAVWMSRLREAVVASGSSITRIEPKSRRLSPETICLRTGDVQGAAVVTAHRWQKLPRPDRRTRAELLSLD